MAEHDHSHDHGPDCACGCNNPHHNHHHHHGPDCDCGCNHHDEGAEAIIENALIISQKAMLSLGPPVAARQILAELIEAMSEIARLVAVEEVVLGHIKALLDCEAGKAAVSITRLDAPDISFTGQWQEEMPLECYSLTLNVLSLANTDADIKPIILRLFPE